MLSSVFCAHLPYVTRRLLSVAYIIHPRAAFLRSLPPPVYVFYMSIAACVPFNSLGLCSHYQSDERERGDKERNGRDQIAWLRTNRHFILLYPPAAEERTTCSLCTAHLFLVWLWSYIYGLWTKEKRRKKNESSAVPTDEKKVQRHKERNKREEKMRRERNIKRMMRVVYTRERERKYNIS